MRPLSLIGIVLLALGAFIIFRGASYKSRDEVLKVGRRRRARRAPEELGRLVERRMRRGRDDHARVGRARRAVPGGEHREQDRLGAAGGDRPGEPVRARRARPPVRATRSFSIRSSEGKAVGSSPFEAANIASASSPTASASASPSRRRRRACGRRGRAGRGPAASRRVARTSSVVGAVVGGVTGTPPGRAGTYEAPAGRPRRARPG